MSKKQSRRTVSLSRDMYDRLKAHSEVVNVPMSQLVEIQLTKMLADPRETITSAQRERAIEAEARAAFTF